MNYFNQFILVDYNQNKTGIIFWNNNANFFVKFYRDQ